MPIYAYRCASCGHAQDVLRKLSDPALSTCPACAAETFEKQLTAAGFQLKGSGWYVTDFRDGPKAAVAGNGKTEADKGKTEADKGKTEADKGKTEAAAPAKPAGVASGNAPAAATSGSAPAPAAAGRSSGSSPES